MRSASWLAVAALAAVCIALVAPTRTSTLAPTSTLQQRHVASVSAVADGGPSALRDHWHAWLSDRGQRDEPSPLRITPLVAGAMWSAAFGATPGSLAWLALSAHIALVVLQFVFARRHWGDAFALGLAALTAFAPLSLGTARLALGDGVAVLFQVASVWLFLEILRDPRRWAWRIAFGLVLALALLASEVSLVLVPSFAVVAWLSERKSGSTRSWAHVLSIVAVATLASASCALVVAGDWASFARVVRLSTWAPPRNVYVIQFASGPWFRCVVDALLISPLPTLLGIAGLAVVAAQARFGSAEAARARLALLIVLQVLALSFFAKGARNALFVDAFVRVLALVFLSELLAQLRSSRARVAFAASVALLCALDARDFRRNFAQPDLEDPVTSELAASRAIVPGAAQPDE